MKTVILVGGGHAQLFVLLALARHRSAAKAARIVLITPDPLQYYSGMLPSWMAGHYRQDDCAIDLVELSAAAGIELILSRLVSLDADQQRITLENGETIEFDFASLDVGSETHLGSLAQLGRVLLPVKPLTSFIPAWSTIIESRLNRPKSIVVVGGGAAAIELALAARHAHDQQLQPCTITLVTPAIGLLPDQHHSLRSRAQRQLERAGVNICVGPGEGSAHGFVVAGARLHADNVIAATGAASPRWLAQSGLGLARDGFVAVDRYHRSVSHDCIFAAGDVCTRVDVGMARSGVHAVRAGPVVAANLLAAIGIGKLKSYRPKRWTLYILACGPKYAIVSWGPWSLEGRWAWLLKDAIDRRFIARFSRPG